MLLKVDRSVLQRIFVDFDSYVHYDNGTHACIYLNPSVQNQPEQDGFMYRNGPICEYYTKIVITQITNMSVNYV